MVLFKYFPPPALISTTTKTRLSVFLIPSVSISYLFVCLLSHNKSEVGQKSAEVSCLIMELFQTAFRYCLSLNAI